MSKPQVFISYSHLDEPWKNRLQKHLEVLDRRGSLWFWEDRQIAAGADWRAEIQTALDSVQAAILLVSVDFLRSSFIRDAEVPAILQRRMRDGLKVFPLIVGSCSWRKEEWLSGLQARPTDGVPLAQFDKDDDVDRVLAGFAGEIAALLNPAPLPCPAPTGSECPYLGLEAFTENKRHLFFGRDAFTDAILQKLDERAFVAVVGPSGSGKSSVVQAGVFPRLESAWRKLVFQPGDDPFLNLADKLVELRGANYRHFSERSKAVEAVARQIRDDRSIAAAVAEALPPERRLLLVADQFEELFTLTPVAERQPFVEALLAAPHLTQLKVLATLRADFYGQAISLTPELSQWLQDGVVNHRPLQRADWEAVILKPAHTAGLQVDPALLELILQEIEAQPDSLPLLEYALKELWQQRAQGRLGLAQYEAIGKLAGAINQRADAVLAQLPAEQQPLALRALTRLVRVSGGEEDGADTRLRLPLSELTVEQREVLQRFVDERLLVTNRHDRSGTEIIEVAHEALIRRWGKLREAVVSDREFLVWRQRLDFRRQEWEENQKHESVLLRGVLLTEAVSWLRERAAELTPAEIEFITWEDRPEFQIEQILTDGVSLFPFARDEEGDNWLFALIFCGETERAYSSAHNIEETYYAVMALSAITIAQAKVGCYDAAQNVVAEILNMIQATDHFWEPEWALTHIAKAFAKLGMVSETLHIASHINDDLVRAQTSIARAFVKAGKLNEAGYLVSESLLVARKVEDLGTRIRCLSLVIRVLVSIKKLDDARNLVLEILPHLENPQVANDVYYNVWDKKSVVLALLETGFDEEAITYMRQIESAYEHAQVLRLFVSKLIKLHRIAEAWSIVTEYRLTEIHLDTLSLIILSLVQSGRRAEAYEVATIALTVVKQIPIPAVSVRAQALGSLAKSFIQVGMTVELLADIRELGLASDRASALMSVADCWIQMGLINDTRLLLDEIYGATDKIFDEEQRSRAMRHLASILAQLHSYRPAREAAEQCSRSGDRLAAYTAILREYHIERNPSLARLFAEEAAEAEEED